MQSMIVCTGGCKLKRPSLGVLLLASALVLLQNVSARAANFYVLYNDRSSSNPMAVVLNPATIAHGASGHMIAHVDNVSRHNSWFDDKWELDCSRTMLRSVARASHNLICNGTTDWVLS